MQLIHLMLTEKLFFVETDMHYLKLSFICLSACCTCHTMFFLNVFVPVDILNEHTLSEILLMLHFNLDPLQSTKVVHCNHHIRNWPTVNWPIVEPLAVNILSAEGRRVIWVYFRYALNFVLQLFLLL